MMIIFLWPRPTTCGILVSQPGIEPRPTALKAPSLKHWTARELPHISLETTTQEIRGRNKCKFLAQMANTSYY